jgi:capsid protein
VPVGQPWIDPLKEVQADVLALHNGLISRQEIARRRGKDYATILEEMIEDPLATTTLAEQTGIDLETLINRGQTET